MAEKKAIIVIGLPGSGKGTQASILAEHLGYFHFETSRIVKEWIKNHPHRSLVHEAMQEYSSGGLFPPKLTAEVVIEETKKIIPDWPGIVFDGSPRTLEEVKTQWPVWLKLFGLQNITVLNIELSFEQAQARLKKRLLCMQGHTFIEGEKGFSIGSPCPNDSLPLERRDLDDPKIVTVRFKEFEAHFSQVLEFLHSNHKVININGGLVIEEVAKEIRQKLGV